MPNDVIIWLVRHGETVWNAQGKISGWVDVELSSRGQQMAKDLRANLQDQHFDQVWSSDLKRAQDTASLAYHRPARSDKRLRELDFGPLEGEIWQDIPTRYQHAMLNFHEDCTRGGEKISDFEHRVFDFLNQLPPGHHLLFVHACVIRVALRRVQADRFVEPLTIAIINWGQAQLLKICLPPEIGT